MGGIGLSRLWGSHPRLAFVLHLIVTLTVGGFALSFIVSGGGLGTVLVLLVGFVLMATSLVFLTWFAIKDQWQSDDSDSSEPAALPTPRAAWRNALARERALWVLFAVAFLGGISLGWAAKSAVGGALVVLSIPLAVVAIRAGR